MSDDEQSDKMSDSAVPNRPLIAYSRQDLLALYNSPLVPSRLDGMKELAEWYGEYADPLASPPTRPRDMHSLPARSNSSNNVLSSGRANPFTNFGRFGVDGGLEGSDGVNTKLGGDRRSGRDAAPHLGGNGEGRGTGGRNGRFMNGERSDKYGAESTSPTKTSTGFFSNERERSERMKTRGDAQAGANGRERRDDMAKKDRRADEGGWRSVGGPDRERRLGRNNADSRDSRDTRESRDPRRDRDSTDTRRAGRAPAWMDDEPTSSSASPAWMDAPATGAMTFGSDGHVLDKPSKAAPPGLGPADGVDSIQAWKKQMKEMERKEKERMEGGPAKQDSDTINSQPATQTESAGTSLLNSLLQGATKGDSAPSASQPSVFETLGLRASGESTTPSAATASASASEGADGAGPRGGRGSRFAKFFDGKTPTAQSPPPASAPQPSVFDALLGGSAKASGGTSSPGPSKEDSDSMARLLGMLQVSGARATSPVVSKSFQSASQHTDDPVSADSVKAPSPASNARPKSRFASESGRFSTKNLGAANAAQQQHASGEGHAPLQSPPLQPSGGSTQPLAAPPQQKHSEPAQASRDISERSDIAMRASSPPVREQRVPSAAPASPSSHQQKFAMPPNQHQQQQQTGGLPSHLLGPQSAASRPLPPLTSPPPNGLLPMSLGPNSRPIPPHQVFSPPPPDLPAHLRSDPSQHQQQHNAPGFPPMHQFGRPPMPPGSAPPFMMYPPPPPLPHQMYGGLPLPPQFRGPMPPPPPMPSSGGMGIPFGPGGVPDLMALLNSGGGGGRGGPPRAPAGPDVMRQYMPMEEQR